MTKHRILYKFIVKDVEVPEVDDDGIITELSSKELSKFTQPILECFNKAPWISEYSGNPSGLVVIPGAAGDIVDISITFAHNGLKPYTVNFSTEPTKVICYEHLKITVRPRMWTFQGSGWEAPIYGTGKFYVDKNGRNSVGEKIDVFMSTASDNSMWHLGTGYPNFNTQLADNYYYYSPERDVVSIYEQKNGKANTVYRFRKRIEISGTGGYEEFREKEGISEGKHLLAIEVNVFGNIIVPWATPDTSFGVLKDTILWIYDVTILVNGIEVEKYKPASGPNLRFVDGGVNITPNGNTEPGTFETGKRASGSILIANKYKYAPWERYPDL